MDWKDGFPRDGIYFEAENGILYHGDCLSVLNAFPKESVDLIVTDPPYGVSYKTKHRKDKTHKFNFPIKNDDSVEVAVKAIPLFAECLKSDRAIYVFSSWKTQEYFKAALNKYLKLKNIIVWVKNNWTAGDLLAGYGYQYEVILYANKGRAPLKGKRYSDVWHCKRVSGKLQKHQNQKPIELIERMLESHSEEGDIVLDAFAGSGSTLVACERLGRRWIGIELEEEYCETIKERILSISK